jgi:hypothetical protein
MVVRDVVLSFDQTRLEPKTTCTQTYNLLMEVRDIVFVVGPDQVGTKDDLNPDI